MNLLSFAPNTIGGPLTREHVHASTRSCRPTTSSTCGSACTADKWDVALFGNNLTDERALLSLDQERGTRARVGYLTNQPRTFGSHGALQPALSGVPAA